MLAHISEDGLREETLAEHTARTAALCEQKGMRCGIPHMMKLCGIIHDMGKAKATFENYLHLDEAQKRKLRGTIAHASTGAKYIYDKYHNAADVTKKILVELVSYAVAAHHGLFDCVNIEEEDIFSRKIEYTEDYAEACTNSQNEFLKDYDLETLFELAYQELQKLVQKMMSHLAGKQRSPRELAFFLACLERLMVSILIDSDWEATAYFMEQVNVNEEDTDGTLRKAVFEQSRDNFYAYIEKLNEKFHEKPRTQKEVDIFHARGKLQVECRKFAKHPSGIYCLSIPTGGGKTLSGLAYALEYCRQYPKTERIIYVSPFISVTEQNADVFRKAIGHSEWILEHHSAVVREENNEGEDYKKDSRCQMDINWEESFVCTTFVQFMNALFSDKKQALRRMHRLINAVVIIDEVQSMPIKCVVTFNCMMNFLNMICNTDIILCTATQPAFGETDYPIAYANPRNMIANPEKWFQQFERVDIQFPKKDKKYTFAALSEEIMAQTQIYNSVLVVLNTKSAVRKLYDLLKARNISAEYLTTNLCAEHRSDKLNYIKQRLQNNKKSDNRQDCIVVVSTNLIEAGVDISFACVYRSMAGLDSVAQTAGRCNRNGEMSSGTLHLIELEGELTGSMNELLEASSVTREVFYQYDGKGSILFPQWIDLYYRRLFAKTDIRDRMRFPLRNVRNIKRMDANILQLLTDGFVTGSARRRRLRNCMNQAFLTAGQAYQIIDDTSFGVIVPYKQGREIIKLLQQTTDFMEVRQCIRKAQRYTVNVRESQWRKLEGVIEPVSEHYPNIYMISADGAYHEDYGITEELETLIV